MDPGTLSQRDNHNGDGDTPAGSTAQSVTETSSSHSAPDQRVIASLLSDKFMEEFDTALEEIPKGDYRRAKGLFLMGGQFNLQYTKTMIPIFLNKAISVTRRALDELPKPHEKLKEYVVIYVHLLQQKAEKSSGLNVAQRLEAVNSYISGLELGIGYLEECSLKAEKMRELGCAYLSRFGQYNDVEDLMLAIETLETCFETPEQVYCQATIYLGSALRHRYEQDKNLNSLERSLDLLYKGLEAIPSDENHYAPLRAYGLGVFISLCARISEQPGNGDLQRQTINFVEKVLSFTDLKTKEAAKLKKQHLKLIMKEFFREPESGQDLLDTLKLGADSRVADNQANLNVERILPSINKTLAFCPLLDNKKNIRLLKLLPGKEETFVHCDIVVEDLSSAIRYEALSYVWGDPENTKKIVVDGCVHKVTKNLYSALTRLRYIETTRLLWIDALCINQTNLDEKRHQIGLMRDIYQNATTVIMWLGEPESQEIFIEPHQNTDTHSKPSTGERIMEFDKAKLDSDEKPHILDIPESREHVSDASISSSLNQQIGRRELEILMEKSTSLRPVLFGCKPVSRISNEGFPGFMDMMGDLIQTVEQKQHIDLLYHNIRISRLTGPGLQVSDWTAPENITSFYKSPQSPSMWPILGAFTLIHSFSQLLHFSQLPFFEGTEEDLSYPNAQTWIKSASALDKILSSEYWERAWILQEVVLAKNPLIHYGPHIMHLDELLQASYAFDFHYTQCCSKWGDNAHRKTHTYWTELGNGFKKFDKLHQLRRAHGVPSTVFANLSISDSSSQNKALLSLSSIMRSGIGNRKATDPRDLVYGILGLVNGDAGIEADYTSSLARVFARSTAQMISEEQTLQVLTLNHLGKHVEHDLPSWVPDWTSSGTFCPQPYPGWLYKPDQGRNYYAEIDHELKLKVRSIKVDTVIKVGGMRTVSWNRPAELVKLLKEWRAMAGLDCPDQTKSPEQAELENTFWRAVFADAITEHNMKHQPPDDQKRNHDKDRRFEARDLVKVQAWWDWLNCEMDSNVISPEMEWHSLRTRFHPDGFHLVTDCFWQRTETRKMIFTQNNRMGTGPSEFGNYIEFGDAKVGDEVHVLFGLNVPVILRALEEGDDRSMVKGTKKYALIGSCYLHGIMDGEVVGDDDEGIEEILLV